MIIKTADFVISAFEPDQYPESEIPEIAFAGRSNVGKSSLMNALLKRKKLVKTSSTPGKTQSINYFLINESYHFVDLPGFGYAKVPKSVKKKWGPMMDTYFKIRKNLRVVVCLIDARRVISDLDVKLFDYLEKYKRHRILVFTKFDKLKKNERRDFKQKAKKKFGLDTRDYFTVSVLNKLGIEELWEELEIYLSDVLNQQENLV